MSLPAVFDKVNNILIILPDNVELGDRLCRYRKGKEDSQSP